MSHTATARPSWSLWFCWVDVRLAVALQSVAPQPPWVIILLAVFDWVAFWSTIATATAFDSALMPSPGGSTNPSLLTFTSSAEATEIATPSWSLTFDWSTVWLSNTFEGAAVVVPD